MYAINKYCFPTKRRVSAIIKLGNFVGHFQNSHAEFIGDAIKHDIMPTNHYLL
jgi:hypothetical protein